MFIVFEGIDGSGKTTLSNRVAGRLRRAGARVAHVRENGRFASSVTQSIRELGRDQRNLAMTPRAEMLLSIARDVQLLEEATLPALRGSDVVLADRFLYTAAVLAEHGRGLPGGAVDKIVTALSCSVEPDLVFLVDVDPHLARARRKVSKVLAADGPSVALPSSRKGLGGAAMQQRIRAGYRALAERDPERWVVIDNTDASLEEVESAIADGLQAMLTYGPSRGREVVRSRLAELSRKASVPAVRAAGIHDARDKFLAWVDRRAASEPDVAAYFLGGLYGPGLDERRRALAGRPSSGRVIASGLRGMDDEVSWILRRQLAESAPGQIAASLRDAAGIGRAATRMRWALLPHAPAAVASSLIGLDDRAAWELRAELREIAPLAVLGSLGGLRTAQAWSWRERLLEHLGGDAALATSYELAAAVCRSIGSLEDERAWELRETAYRAAPVSAIHSLWRATDERAAAWRDRHVERAPKSVMRSIAQMTDEHSWALRERVAGSCKEVIDSLRGLDDERAWELRDRCRDRWPSTVAASLGPPLALGARGAALITYLLENHGGIALLRAATGIAAAADRLFLSTEAHEETRQ